MMDYDIYEILNNIEKRIENCEILTYDEYNISWFNLNFDRFLETLKLVNKYFPYPSKVLDIGCSPGYLTLALKLIGHNVYGIDVEPKRIQELFNKNNIIVKKCDLNSDIIPFNGQEFNCIIFTEVIEHINYVNINRIINELKRVLKNDGLIILSTPNLTALENRLLLLIGKEIIRSSHNRVFTLKELLNLFKSHNLDVKESKYSLVRDKISHKILNKVITKEHVLKGFIKYPNWKNFGRALIYPLKILVPQYRSCIFLIINKIIN